jgi:hypothetical protein
MVPLPRGFSLQANPIRSALSEGRTEDAKRLTAEILRTGKADHVVQGIAADLLRPPKRAPGRQKSLPRFWFEIGEVFHDLRRDGLSFEEATEAAAEQFGFSERHIRNAVSFYDKTQDE